MSGTSEACTSPYETESRMACPHCGRTATLVLPGLSVPRWTCPGCGVVLEAGEGECCAVCAHGDVPCLPIQAENLKWQGFGMCCQEAPE
ncbi:MAG: hypothetical protein H7841_12945 [Magnetospirillum sp. WYHS-4]